MRAETMAAVAITGRSEGMTPAWALLPGMALWLMAGPASLIAQDVRPAPLSESVRAQWALDDVWDDGRAEVATYQGERVLGGAPRNHILHLITMKEDFNREYNVKADWPYGQKPILAVLKQNQVTTIPTPNFPVHFMASVFVERDDPARLLKISVSSQEWSGMTTKEFDFSGRVPRRTWASYRDGEGSGSETLRAWPREAVFEEQLPLLVRTLELRDGLEAGLALAPNQTTTGAPSPEPVAARLRVERPREDIEVPAGTWPREDVWRVSIEGADGRSLEFVLAEAMPRVLLAWSVNDGRFYVLQHITRDAFWQIRDEAMD